MRSPKKGKNLINDIRLSIFFNETVVSTLFLAFFGSFFRDIEILLFYTLLFLLNLWKRLLLTSSVLSRFKRLGLTTVGRTDRKGQGHSWHSVLYVGIVVGSKILRWRLVSQKMVIANEV